MEFRERNVRELDTRERDTREWDTRESALEGSFVALPTHCSHSNDLKKVVTWSTLKSESFDDIFRETEANDGQLGRLDDNSGHPAEHVGGERPKGHQIVRIFGP